MNRLRDIKQKPRALHRDGDRVGPTTDARWRPHRKGGEDQSDDIVDTRLGPHRGIGLKKWKIEKMW
jgi:hypothetical protein